MSSWRQMARSGDDCSDSLRSLNCGENRTFDNDRQFRSKVDCKAYRQLQKLAVSNNYAVSLCFLYGLDAAATPAVDNFERCSETYVGHAKIAVVVAAAPIGFEANNETGAKKYS